MRIHAILPDSRVHGPGVSFVIWFQGCRRHCTGCCNPESWDPDGGSFHYSPELIKQILSLPNLDNVVFSGGEPLEQKYGLMLLVHLLVAKQTGLRFILFTGRTEDQIRMVLSSFDYALFDLIVSGPFEQNNPGVHPLLASANQRFLFPSGQMSLKDLDTRSAVEVITDESNGTITQTGREIVPGLGNGEEIERSGKW